MDNRKPITTAKEYFKFLESEGNKRLKDATGVLYDPIVKDDWTTEALRFTNGEKLSKDELIEIVYEHNKAQLDSEEVITGSNPYYIWTLHKF